MLLLKRKKKTKKKKRKRSLLSFVLKSKKSVYLYDFYTVNVIVLKLISTSSTRSVYLNI